MDLFGDLPEPGQAKEQPKSLSPAEVQPLVNAHSSETSSESLKRKLVDVEKNEESVKKTTVKTCYYTLQGCVADRQGEREDMQDAHLIMDDYRTLFSGLDESIQRLSMYAVFDGHGGVRASRFASEHLHNNLRDKFPKGNVVQVEKEIKKAIVEAFKKTDEDFLKQAARNKPSWKDGSTAVVVVCINDTLYIANLGDSKAVLCRFKEKEGKYLGVPLTEDHKPALYQERMRIQKAGGFVKEGRVMGQLEVSRSLGDGPYKNHGVTCVPDIKRCQLTDQDRFLLIACDGLWKEYTDQESIEAANKILEEASLPEPERPQAVCSRLASAAVLRLSGDNVTVMMVAIGKAQNS